MPIITISRGSYNKGKQVAEEVAKCLGYECIARDVVLEASEQFNIAEARLVRGIHDAPSVLDQFAYGKKRYRAFIQAALLKHFQKDNVVYHGLAGQFFLKGISHVLAVRINAEMEDRVREEMARSNISWAEALRILQEDDEERRKWSLSLYNIDTKDQNLYDLIIKIRKMTVEDAAQVICETAVKPQFQSTPESRKEMEDLVLASQVHAALVTTFPDIKLAAAGGNIVVYATSADFRKEEYRRDIEKAATAVPGVKAVVFQE
jgi:cytidylate kinase